MLGSFRNCIQTMKYLLVVVSILCAASAVKAASYKVTDQVYFDIMIDDYPAGRIVVGLFGELAPKTVKNFITLATTGINGRTYAGSKFHRVIKKFMIQGGDLEKGDGSGSISIYGKYFDDETFEVKHTGAGFISMANAGKNTNGCQFFITTIATPWLDGQHTAFGKVVEGIDVVFKIEQTKTDSDDKPVSPVVILESGTIKTKSPFYISDDPYDMWAWIKATAIPLSFSFTILGFFQWMIRKLDACDQIDYGKFD
ncbi:peptidyl-prolyl cis-trans isomerase B-like [Belonocnema kinseyi]|uniref:peptidyl-prolyl cis-trans isomerase B-like n=1 Tax=Belonocnema kinseyi TaxID=2817044 RepID=UPI00143D7681|nr:peptidyl-prolyl cis-trans isomerase B-like [Belonocnema kinseyi]